MLVCTNQSLCQEAEVELHKCGKDLVDGQDLYTLEFRLDGTKINGDN